MFKYLCLLFAVWLALPVVAQEDSRTSSSRLAGQNVVLLGDSNTWIGGDSCDSPRGWNYWFARQMNPLTIRSYARSGATWSHTSRTVADTREYSEVITDNNVIYNQILRLVEAVDSGRQTLPDLVMVSAGTNDAWFPHLRPEQFSRGVREAVARDETELMMLPPSKVVSLTECVKYDLLVLRERFPDARIIVMTPLQSIRIAPEMLSDISGMIEAVATDAGADVIRQDLLCPVNSLSEMTTRRLTTDGTHTSEEGARRNAAVISDFVENIYKSTVPPTSVTIIKD